MKKYIKISILVDNPNSWINGYLDKLFRVVQKYDNKFHFVKDNKKIPKGDVLFILGCDRILTKKQLSLHKNNIIVHESDLPKGRGWSPLTRQVEAGKNKIPITLFEACEKCDAGDYYLRDCIKLNGRELIDNIRKKQINKTIKMIEKYLVHYPMMPLKQKGKATYYRKRKPEDHKLNINKSLKSQFNKIRTADNQHYPLHFWHRKKRYILKVYSDKE